MKRILLIEDDLELLEGLKDNLEIEGYDVTTATNGHQGVLEAARHQPDAVVLDLMIPKLSGFDVCRTLRERGFDAPILILSARGQESDKIKGFALGADDYLTKPFSIHELVARLRAIIRRSGRPSDELRSFEFDDVKIDFDTQQLRKNREVFVLSQLEADVLRYFVMRRGQVVRREDLLAAIWGYQTFTTRAVDNLIARLRSKIEDSPHKPRHILSVYGVGYKFVP